MPSIRIGKTSIGGGSLRTSWTPQMLTPNFAFDDTYWDLSVGQQVTVYGETLIDLAINNNLHVTYTCDIGSQSGNDYTINPLVGNIGNHNLTMVFKNGGTTFLTKTVVVRINAKEESGLIRVLRLGDSTTIVDVSRFEAAMPNCMFEWIGTKGTTYKHEGYSGYAYVDYAIYVEGRTCALIKNQVLDIPAYFTDNSLKIPDFVYIRLGVNDIANSYMSVAAALGYAKTLIDAFLAFNAKLKVIIALPTICTNSSDVWLADYPGGHQAEYITKMHEFHLAFVQAFYAGAYNSRVLMSFEMINMGRGADYANGVHPSADGYNKLIDGSVGYYNKAIKDNYSADILPRVWGVFAGTPVINGQVLTLITGDSVAVGAYWIVGKTYQIKYSTTGTGWHRLYDGANWNDRDGVDVARNGAGTWSTIFTVHIGGTNLFFVVVGTANITATIISIKEVL